MKSLSKPQLSVFLYFLKFDVYAVNYCSGISSLPHKQTDRGLVALDPKD